MEEINRLKIVLVEKTYRKWLNTLKNVVEYADKRIVATKEVIKN